MSKEDYYYNNYKPDVKIVHPIGSIVSFASKTGGGSYIVIGHLNCDRCETIVEEKEWTEMARRHKHLHHDYWCFNCGLWKNLIKTKIS